MMTSAPWRPIVGSCLQEVGSCPRVAEGGDVAAEACGLTWHLKMLHEGEVITVQFNDRRAAAGDNDQDVGRVGVAIAR